MCGDDGKERRGGIEDGGQAAGDAGLAPGEEAEGDGVVDGSHQEHSAPVAAKYAEAKTADEDDDIQRNRGKGKAAEDQGEWPKLEKDVFLKVKRRAPDQSQQEQQRPVARAHAVPYFWLVFDLRHSFTRDRKSV